MSIEGHAKRVIRANETMVVEVADEMSGIGNVTAKTIAAKKAEIVTETAIAREVRIMGAVVVAAVIEVIVANGTEDIAKMQFISFWSVNHDLANKSGHK